MSSTEINLFKPPQKTDSEVWLPVVGYEGLYEVSNQGRVRSIDRDFVTKSGKRYRRKGKIISFAVKKNGFPYKRVSLSKQGWQSMHFVSRLVLTAFVGPPKPGEQACHNNSDPSDNRVENLRWDSPKGNYKDRVKNNTHPTGAKNPNKKLAEEDVLFIRSSKLPAKVLGKLFNVSPEYIYNIRSKITWRHV